MTLAEANEQRDWRLWQDPATGLIKRAGRLYAGEDLELDLDETIYALDSTTIDLSLQLFPLAELLSPLLRLTALLNCAIRNDRQPKK